MHGADRYAVTIKDIRFNVNIFTDKVESNVFQIPMRAALSPGHEYLIKVNALKANKTLGSVSAVFRAPGQGHDRVILASPDFAPLRNFFRKPVLYKSKFPWRHAMTTYALAFDDTDIIRQQARKNAPTAMDQYQLLIDMIRSAGYTFRSFADYTPEDIGKKHVYLRFDVHVNDIGDTYAFMDANLTNRIPAIYDLTWELGPSEFAYAQDFYNLKKMQDEDGLIRFGLHLNPERTWLLVEHFNYDHFKLSAFSGNEPGFREARAMAENGKWKFGDRAEYLKKIDQYTGILRNRMVMHFPDVITASTHGMLPWFTRQNKKEGEDLSESEYERLAAYSAAVALDNKDMLRRHGLLYNHTTEGSKEGTFWVFDPLRGNALLQEKVEPLKQAMQEGKTIFMYIHPSSIYR